MNRRILASLLAVCTILLTSCGNKFAPTSDYFKVTPETLVLKGGKVNATIDGTFPEKTFPTKITATITPVLKYQGGEAVGTPVTLQGEKVQDNNKVIAKTGGSFTTKASFKYIPEMASSELYLRFNVKKGNKTIEVPDVKIADGVISTEALADAKTASPALAEDKFQRIIKEEYKASILYLIQQSNIRYSQKKKEDIKALASELKDVKNTKNKEVANIKISSYASPDGPQGLNERVSSGRDKSAQKYMNREVRRAKLGKQDIESDFTVEDWEGFKELVEKSNIQDKNLILKVLAMYNDPDQREKEIKNLSSVYETLAKDILPQLRRSKLTLTVDVIGKSDDEIKELAKTDPSKLNVDEYLYAATLVNSKSEKKAIYKDVTAKFPNDERAYNNLGKFAFEEGNMAEAKKYFDKAYSINNKNADVNNNMGLYSMAKGDIEAAKTYLGSAAASEGSNESLGILYIKEGQYNKAVKAFGNLKTNNAALAQILTKDYSKASKILDAVAAPDAQTSYLKAVISAKTNDKAGVINNLKKAISLDGNTVSKIKTDANFAKYKTDAAFAALIK